uniref:Uncharacterized protein n=1 Tax=Lygus hesperus TaxID=30085 RepID=A0A146MA63_LYGHE
MINQVTRTADQTSPASACAFSFYNPNGYKVIEQHVRVHHVATVSIITVTSLKLQYGSLCTTSSSELVIAFFFYVVYQVFLRNDFVSVVNYCATTVPCPVVDGKRCLTSPSTVQYITVAYIGSHHNLHKTTTHKLVVKRLVTSHSLRISAQFMHDTIKAKQRLYRCFVHCVYACTEL